MNAPTTTATAAIPAIAAGNGPDRHSAADYGLGIQLSRAGMMALTRLQLAIQSGDRQQAMEAMDRLHALDAEMERLVERLPPPPDNDAQWGAITRHVSDQKLAIAFEKLALVSEISGPDMVSPPSASLPPPPVEGLPPLAEWPPLPEVEPTEWRPISAGAIAIFLALLVTAALASAAVLMTMF